MDNKKKGTLLVVVGIVFILAGVLADVLGLGEAAVFGYKQIVMVVLGVTLLALGIKSK